jgi:cytochrome oxidase assembly protein ShyY1
MIGFFVDMIRDPIGFFVNVFLNYVFFWIPLVALLAFGGWIVERRKKRAARRP